MKALIIGYHCVKDESDSYLRPTSIADFDAQMQYLSKRYHPMSLEKVAQHIRSGEALPPRAIAVTFDDGYRDNYENAYPVLRKYEIPATIFLTTGFIGTGEIPAWDRGFYTSEETLMLSWKQVREMGSDGISFGSHTLTHPLLSRIPRKRVEEELCLSKDIIEQQIGMPVTTFAYPSGDFNSETKELVRESGYAAAVSVTAGHNGLHNDVYALRRNLIQLQSICHTLFPLSFVAEITGVVGHARALYYRMRRF